MVNAKLEMGGKDYVYGSIMLKIALLAHLRYQNVWLKQNSKFQTSVLFGTPHFTWKILKRW